MLHFVFLLYDINVCADTYLVNYGPSFLGFFSLWLSFSLSLALRLSLKSHRFFFSKWKFYHLSTKKCHFMTFWWRLESEIMKPKEQENPRVIRQHYYRKKAATIGQNGRLSASCNFFSFWLIELWGTTNQISDHAAPTDEFS